MPLPTWITIVTAIVTTGTTIALAFITWRYVRLTQEYVRLTNAILKATNTPEVILYLYIYNFTSMVLCIQNIGTGYASNIKFTGDLSFKPTFGDVHLEEVEPFKNGIDYLGAGHKIDTTLFRLEEIPTIKKSPFDIIVSYRDSADIPYSKTFSFNFSDYSSTRQFYRPETDDLGNVLERINRTLEKIGNKLPTQE